MFLHYISDEKIKTTRDQVTAQSNIPVSNFVLLNSVESLTFHFKVIAVEYEVSLLYLIIKDCILLLN